MQWPFFLRQLFSFITALNGFAGSNSVTSRVAWAMALIQSQQVQKTASLMCVPAQPSSNQKRILRPQHDVCTLDHIAPYQATFPTMKTPWPPLRKTVPTIMRQRNVRDFAVFKSKSMVASDLLRANRHRPLRPWTLPWCSTPSPANLAGKLGLPLLALKGSQDSVLSFKYSHKGSILRAGIQNRRHGDQRGQQADSGSISRFM